MVRALCGNQVGAMLSLGLGVWVCHTVPFDHPSIPSPMGWGCSVWPSQQPPSDGSGVFRSQLLPAQQKYWPVGLCLESVGAAGTLVCLNFFRASTHSGTRRWVTSHPGRWDFWQGTGCFCFWPLECKGSQWNRQRQEQVPWARESIQEEEEGPPLTYMALGSPTYHYSYVAVLTTKTGI